MLGLRMGTRVQMKKLLLTSVLMLAFGPAHAFTKEVPYRGSSLGEMSQEDFVCGSIQFSIRPKDGWVVWKKEYVIRNFADNPVGSRGN